MGYIYLQDCPNRSALVEDIRRSRADCGNNNRPQSHCQRDLVFGDWQSNSFKTVDYYLGIGYIIQTRPIFLVRSLPQSIGIHVVQSRSKKGPVITFLHNQIFQIFLLKNWEDESECTIDITNPNGPIV